MGGAAKSTEELFLDMNAKMDAGFKELQTEWDKSIDDVRRDWSDLKSSMVSRAEFVDKNLPYVCKKIAEGLNDKNTKLTIGTVALETAVIMTIMTGGALTPVFLTVAAGTAMGAATNVMFDRLVTGNWDGWEQAAENGAI